MLIVDACRLIVLGTEKHLAPNYKNSSLISDKLAYVTVFIRDSQDGIVEVTKNWKSPERQQKGFIDVYLLSERIQLCVLGNTRKQTMGNATFFLFRLVYKL